MKDKLGLVLYFLKDFFQFSKYSMEYLTKIILFIKRYLKLFLYKNEIFYYLRNTIL